MVPYVCIHYLHMIVSQMKNWVNEKSITWKPEQHLSSFHCIYISYYGPACCFSIHVVIIENTKSSLHVVHCIISHLQSKDVHGALISRPTNLSGFIIVNSLWRSHKLHSSMVPALQNRCCYLKSVGVVFYCGRLLMIRIIL